MGCVRQSQWCNPSLPADQACGPLASYKDSYQAAAPLFGITDEEFNRPRRSTKSLRGSALIWGYLITISNPLLLYEFLGMSQFNVLSSKDRMYVVVAQGLPDDQWKLDVVKWFDTGMAMRQLAYINTARGPSEPELEALRLPPANDYEKTFCENQLSMITQFSRMFLDGRSHIAALKTENPEHRAHILQYVWIMLHICHRQAEEQIGTSTWTKCTSRIPVSAADDVRSTLDITDPKHPKLRRPESPVSGLPLDDLYGSSEEQEKVHITSAETEVENADDAISTNNDPADLELGLLDRPGDGPDESDSHSEVSVLTSPYHAEPSTGAPASPVGMTEVHPVRL
ncbi:uncharacterized protein PG986_004752 [Apiospora aurea]|uniref:Uncharacterized protein n=1 Tax=Apiospora aurea TaxID=335848 RepID=A0ABR1QNG3_9PEZI